MSFKKLILSCCLICALALITVSFSSLAEDIYDPEARFIPDIGTFMKIGFSSSPQITQDGRHVFFTSAVTGIDQLYRLNDDGWPYQLTTLDDGIKAYSVSPDGQLAVVTADIGGTEDAQLFLIDTRTGRLWQLTDNPQVRFGTPIWRHDGTGFYFQANLENPKDRQIYYYDLASGEKRAIFEMEGSNYPADLSLDDRYLLVYHNFSNVWNELHLIDLTTGQTRKITPDKENVIYDYPTILPDNKTIIMVSNDNDDGITKLAKYDIEKMKLEFLEPDSKWTVDLVGFSPNRNYMVYQVNEEGYSVLKLWDWQRQKPLPGPPMKGLLTQPDLANDGKLILRFNNSTTAPDIWLWDWQKPELRQLTYATYAGIDRTMFIEPELISYKSFDGLEIPAFLYLPPDYDGQPVPFIVHAHGGPESQFRPYLQRHFQYLLLNGFGVIAPNVRGSKGYGKEYIGLDDYKNRLNSIKDYKAAVEYLIDNGYTRKGMIGIKGTSYGGYVVLASITEYPDLYAAAIDHVGIANFVTFLQNTRPYRRPIREAEYGPLSDPDFLRSISPIHKADLIEAPLLVVHGVNDPRVPIGEARQIIQAVQNNGGVVDSLIFLDEGHGMSKLENRLDFYRKMVEFFSENLKE